MPFPIQKFCDYHLIDYYEHYLNLYNKHNRFRRHFPNFNHYITVLKYYKPNNSIYLLRIQHESRKYHHIYD